MRGWLIVLMAWAGVVLACNLPLAARVEPLSPPTLPAESAEDPSNEESESAENGTDPVPTATLLPPADNSSGGEYGHPADRVQLSYPHNIDVNLIANPGPENRVSHQRSDGRGQDNPHQEGPRICR